MEKLHFKRQGVGHSLHIEHERFSCKAIGDSEENYLVMVESKHDGYSSRICCSKETSFGGVKKIVQKVVKELLNIDIEIEDFIEAYTYYSDKQLQLYPHLKNDIYVNIQAVYENATDTIRKVPEYYCLIAWRNGNINQPVFNLDGATEFYREICTVAHDEFLKSHNQRNSDRENKEWLAWLVSEWIKERQKHNSFGPVYVQQLQTRG